jgi:hypothetical protein
MRIANPVETPPAGRILNRAKIMRRREFSRL